MTIRLLRTAREPEFSNEQLSKRDVDQIVLYIETHSTEIKKINLRNTQLDDASVQRILNAAMKARNLESFQLSDNNITSDSDNAILAFLVAQQRNTNQPDLTFNLSNNHFDNKFAFKLNALIKDKRFKNCRLVFC